MSTRLEKKRLKELKRSDRLKALGVYIFAGLFTEGVKKHFDVVAHFEEGQFGVPTAKHNNPGLSVFDGQENWPKEKKIGNIDFIYCNPPCAPWSGASAGRAVSWEDDPRVSCWHTAFSMIKRFRPKVWISESVRGVFVKGRPMMDYMAAKARKLGYKATFLYVNAQNHDLPQRRKRFFLVLHRVKINWKPPHGEELTVGQVIGKEVDEVGWYAEMHPRILHLAKHTEPGGNIRRTFERLNKRKMAAARDKLAKLEKGEKPEQIKGRPSFLTFVLNPDDICGVIIGDSKIHWNRERMISINEGKAVCGVRQDFEFQGVPTGYFAQLSKAVLPNVGEYVAKMSRRAIERDRPNRNLRPVFVEIHRDFVEKKKLETEG